MNPIPTDLVLDIFSRLPSKSIVRFRCLSKLWGSKLHHSYFTDFYLIKSSTRPRLLFLLQGNRSLSFFSSPQPQNPYEKSSLVVTAGFRVKIPKDLSMEFIGYASGLIYFCYTQTSEGYTYKVHLICNPSTGQCASLPKLRMPGGSHSFFGFDPIEKQFKILSVAEDGHRILTLGTGEMIWRKIQCPLTHCPYSTRICINGVLYYLAVNDTSELIVCFDVRSEKFKFIEVIEEEECFYYDELINYKGKLGGIFMKNDNADRSGIPKLCLWVLEDVEKQKWSKYVHTLRDDKIDNWYYISVVGMTATGEIVLLKNYKSKPIYVFYFNPVRNTLQSVEIQGFGEYSDANRRSVSVSIDYVEDLNFF
ncbi:hypothetical protein EUTSA_v10009427mg [Eutrema salsugineum]|uniref:F-box domain-containing protein n=1 Tax=Eutrema salsugineum TaxID=72664 RepID=V4KR06_EUTSA|nr:putative F-box protein At1g30925 [Eutrema salsugineum]ESQ33724.1 hypothetical protein EUTSA_v10009427mg [Eutrema salsugineum]